MKLQAQNRLTIPKFIIENSDLNKECFLVFESTDKFWITNNQEGKVLSKMSIDYKGRITIPKDLSIFFQDIEIIIFLEDGKVGIMCLKKDT